MAHPLDGADLRIERAKHHLAELNTLESAYRLAHEKDLVIDFDSSAKITSVRLKEEAKLIPPIFSVILGEAVYNLRAALDYLVFELVRLDWERTQNRAKFLIEDSSASFWGKVNGRNKPLQGLSDRHLGMIEDLQPYKRHEWLKLLREISNLDKHRELTATRTTMEGMAVFQVDMPPDWFPPPTTEGFPLPYYESGKVLHARDHSGAEMCACTTT